MEAQAQMDLSGKVVLVAGASRGAGAGVAKALGARGATVYVTGRSSRQHANEAGSGVSRPGSIEATAEEATQRGGLGIAVRCDHTDPQQVAALVQRIVAEQGKLDLLVNAVWGGNERRIESAPMWELELEHWSGMMTAGVYAAVVTARAVAPVMVKQRKGLIINVSFYDQGRYTGHFFYDLAKAALNRAAYGLAQDLAPHGVAAVSLSPGFMRTELVLEGLGTDEEHWQEVAGLAGSESPEYLGAAVAALASDPAGAMTRSGETLLVADLARQYGFSDIDGSQPGPFVLP